MASVIAWPEIEGFSNIRKYTQAHPEILNGKSKVTYRTKCKLHGMNHAIQVHTNGTIVCQSRTAILTPEADNAGFAKWVEENKEPWNEAMGFVVYGEWVGKGIQKSVALAELPNKVFAVFAARRLPIEEFSEDLIVDPQTLRELICHIPETYVIPWYQSPLDTTLLTIQLDIDWSLPDEQLTMITSQINEWVAAVEKEDPWVKDNFGISGMGEGLVFYPRSPAHDGYTNFSNLTFKAKGEAHKLIKTAKPAQVNAESAASVEAFVAMVLTVARLEQGAAAVALTPGEFSRSQTGKFVSWIVTDVTKETQDELAASNLTMAQVQKLLTEKARQWYLSKAK